MAKKRRSRGSKSVSHRSVPRPRSTRASKEEPMSGARVWVDGYTRENGTHVAGYYRASA
jgi:hypothetical protein